MTQNRDNIREKNLNHIKRPVMPKYKQSQKITKWEVIFNTHISSKGEFP